MHILHIFLWITSCDFVQKFKTLKYFNGFFMISALIFKMIFGFLIQRVLPHQYIINQGAADIQVRCIFFHLESILPLNFSGF